MAPVYFTAPLRVAANGVEPATNKQDVKEHIGPRNLDNTSNKPGSSTPGTVLPDNNGINPWDLDIQPNPVMFPHLATPIPSRPSGQFIRSHYNDDDNTIPEWLQKAREVRMVGPDFTPNSYSCVAEELHMTAELIDSTVKFQTMESWSSEDTAYSWASTAITAVDDEWREISPATSISSTPDLDKGKGLLAGLVDTVPLANFVAATPEPTVSDIAKRSSFEMKQYQVPDIEKLSHGGLEAIEIIATETLIPLPAPEESLSTDSQYSCPKCNLHFRTPGLRRYVAVMCVKQELQTYNSRLGTTKTASTILVTYARSAIRRLGYAPILNAIRSRNIATISSLTDRKCTSVQTMAVLLLEKSTTGRITSRSM